MNAPLPSPHVVEPKDFSGKDNRRMDGLFGDMRRRILGKKYPTIRRTASAVGLASAVILGGLTARHYADDGQKTINLTTLDCKGKEKLPPGVIVELEKSIGQKVISICSHKRFGIGRDNVVTGTDGSVYFANNIDIPNAITVEKQ